jgi:hypothetical protein
MTQQLTTIPSVEVAAPEAVSEASVAFPAAEQGPVATTETHKVAERDPHLDLAKKFESVAQKEGRARKAEREAQARLATLTEREAKLAAREAELEEALGDPVGHMLKIGKDPVEVAKRYAQPESPSSRSRSTGTGRTGTSRCASRIPLGAATPSMRPTRTRTHPRSWSIRSTSRRTTPSTR